MFNDEKGAIVMEIQTRLDVATLGGILAWPKGHIERTQQDAMITWRVDGVLLDTEIPICYVDALPIGNRLHVRFYDVKSNVPGGGSHKLDGTPIEVDANLDIMNRTIERITQSIRDTEVQLEAQAGPALAKPAATPPASNGQDESNTNGMQLGSFEGRQTTQELSVTDVDTAVGRALAWLNPSEFLIKRHAWGKTIVYDIVYRETGATWGRYRVTPDLEGGVDYRLNWFVDNETARQTVLKMINSEIEQQRATLPASNEQERKEQAEDVFTAEYLAGLRRKIVEYFDDSDLRDLCFDMGIDYADLPGQSKKDKARELVDRCKRTSRVPDLVAQLQTLRPKVSWKYDAELLPPPLTAPSAALSNGQDNTGANDGRPVSFRGTQMIPRKTLIDQVTFKGSVEEFDAVVRDCGVEIHNKLLESDIFAIPPVGYEKPPRPGVVMVSLANPDGPEGDIEDEIAGVLIASPEPGKRARLDIYCYEGTTGCEKAWELLKAELERRGWIGTQPAATLPSAAPDAPNSPTSNAGDGQVWRPTVPGAVDSLRPVTSKPIKLPYHISFSTVKQSSGDKWLIIPMPKGDDSPDDSDYQGQTGRIIEDVLRTYGQTVKKFEWIKGNVFVYPDLPEDTPEYQNVERQVREEIGRAQTERVLKKLLTQTTGQLYTPPPSAASYLALTSGATKIQQQNREIELHIDDIDSFEKVRAITPQEVKPLVPLDLLEDQVQTFFEDIIGENFHQKDWGGEMNDLVSSHVKIGGRRLRAAFILKGRGTKGKLTIKDCGKDGDQIVRLVEAPVDLYIIQHVDEIDQRVVYDLKSKVELKNKKGEPCQMCIIDGTDTARILVAYDKIPGAS